MSKLPILSVIPETMLTREDVSRWMRAESTRRAWETVNPLQGGDFSDFIATVDFASLCSVFGIEPVARYRPQENGPARPWDLFAIRDLEDALWTAYTYRRHRLQEALLRERAALEAARQARGRV